MTRFGFAEMTLLVLVEMTVNPTLQEPVQHRNDSLEPPNNSPESLELSGTSEQPSLFRKSFPFYLSPERLPFDMNAAILDRNNGQLGRSDMEARCICPDVTDCIVIYAEPPRMSSHRMRPAGTSPRSNWAMFSRV